MTDHIISREAIIADGIEKTQDMVSVVEIGDRMTPGQKSFLGRSVSKDLAAKSQIQKTNAELESNGYSPLSPEEENQFQEITNAGLLDALSHATDEIIDRFFDTSTSSADSAIDAGFGDENGEFGSTPTSDDSSSSQSDQDWNNPTNPGDQSNTTVSDSPYSTKMDRDYGVTQSSFEAAREAMFKMGRADSYKTPPGTFPNRNNDKKEELENPDDPNAGQVSSSPQDLTRDSGGGWSGVGRSSIDNPTNSPSYSSDPSSGGQSSFSSHYSLTPDQRDALGGYGKYSGDRDNGPVSQSSSSSSSGDWSGVGRSSIDNPTNAPSYSSNTSSGGPSYGPPSVSSSYRGSGSSNHSDSGNSNSGSGKPIVMDMDGDGVELIPMADNNALFDMDADGYREMITANPERAMHATTHLR